MKRAAIGACSLAAALMMPAAALADPTAAEKITATQLFDDAEMLLAAGNVVGACPKYAESQRLDPQLGTLLHLANCYEKEGKTASAWSGFKEATELAAKRKDPRQATARARAASLEPRLSKIIVTVAAGAPSEIDVRQDGQVVRRAAWGSAVPVDPGAHTIVARATGYKTWEMKVEVRVAGAVSTIKVPELEPLPKTEPLARVAVPSVGTLPAPSDPLSNPPPTARPGSGQRIAGLVVAGAGVVAIGVSLGIGASAKSQYDGADCPSNVCRTSADGTERDHAATKATLATVVFGVGAAALVGGGVMWLTAPSQAESASTSARSLSVGVGPGEVLIRGAF